ncbi:hypothetical protein Aperf_G00000014761 [Anoplocephala perfoliata]
MQQAYRHNGWNSSPHDTWNRQENQLSTFTPNSNAYLGTNRIGSALSIDAENGGELTPLPRARNQNGLPPKSRSSSSGRFWTPRIDISPEKKNIFAGKEIYNKFLASLRMKKAQTVAASKANPVTSTKVNGDADNAAKPPKSEAEMVTARVLLLDGEEVSMKISKRAFGVELIQRICDGQDIIETDYFGITYSDKKLGTWACFTI